MTRLLLVLTAVALVPTACGGGTDPGTTSAARQNVSHSNADTDIEGIAWQLVSGTGPDGAIELVPGYRITLGLAEGHAGGTSACNTYGSSATVTGDRLILGELGGTAMGCEPDVMASESAYIDGLLSVERFSRVDGDLVLSGPSTELRFTELPPFPIDELVDRTWRLDTVIAGGTASPAAGDEATLRIGRHSLEGSTGCRTFTGAFVISGDELRTTRLTAQQPPVQCPFETNDQDGAVFTVIGDGFQAAVDNFRALVDGDRLTLTATGGNSLIYKAE